jgi:hypothetical protein
MHSAILMQKSHGGRLAIGWQAGLATCRANRPPHDFGFSKAAWIIGVKVINWLVFNSQNKIVMSRTVGHSSIGR